MYGLTEAQKRAIEENRKKALAIREAKRLKSEPSVMSYFAPAKPKSQEVSIIKEIRSSSVIPEPIVRPQQSNTVQPSTRPQEASSSQSRSVQPVVVKSIPPRPQSQSSPFSRPNSMTDSSRTKSTPSSYNRNVPQRSTETKQEPKKNNVAPIFANAAKIRVTISLAPHHRLMLGFGYNMRLIEAIKKIPSCKYERERNRWTVHVNDYEVAINTFSEIQKSGINVEIDSDSVPAKVVAVIRNELDKQDTDVNLSDRLDQVMIDKMFPFQREGAKFAIRKNGRCLIGDDMGLGKTVQALATAAWFRDDWPLLIVCPASVAVNWKNNVLNWLRFVREDQVEVFDKPGPFSQRLVVVVSYDRLVRISDDVINRKMNFVILDESHNIKSSDAQRTKVALAVAKKVKHIVLLSGTPALSRPMELYTQILAINNQLFPKKHDFGARYCDARMKFLGRAQVWDYQGCSNSEELKILLESTIMIRRLKVDVLQDLPTKRRVVVKLPLKLSEEGQKKMDSLGRKLQVANPVVFKSALNEWYMESAAQKVDAIIEYIENKLKKCKKFICFGHHKVMFEHVSEYLRNRNISFIVITGETPAKIRQACCDYFQETPTCRIALVSIVAAGVGITLTAAHEVVFTELYWNPGILTQAEDRAHRIGQEESVTIEYLLSPNTVDEYIWEVVGKKLNVLNKVGLSEDDMKSSVRRDSSQATINDFFQKISDEVPTEEPGLIVLN